MDNEESEERDNEPTTNGEDGADAVERNTVLADEESHIAELGHAGEKAKVAGEGVEVVDAADGAQRLVVAMIDQHGVFTTATTTTAAAPAATTATTALFEHHRGRTSHFCRRPGEMKVSPIDGGSPANSLDRGGFKSRPARRHAATPLRN